MSQISPATGKQKVIKEWWERGGKIGRLMWNGLTKQWVCGGPCGSWFSPYEHLVFSHPAKLFVDQASVQASAILSSIHRNARKRHRVRQILLQGNQSFYQPFETLDCILSVSIFSHGGFGYVDLFGPGQNLVVPGHAYYHDESGAPSGVVSGGAVVQLENKGFVSCPGCMFPAQIMLYSCRSMLGASHRHQYSGHLPTGLSVNPIVDFDHANSVGAALAQHFYTKSYGTTGGTGPHHSATVTWPRVSMNPTTPDNWWQGARWVYSDGASFTESPSRLAWVGSLTHDP